MTQRKRTMAMFCDMLGSQSRDEGRRVLRQQIFPRKEKLEMAVEKTIGSTSLAEVVDRILDKGIVVDAWVRVSLVGIELLAVEARVVVAGVDTYLKYAEAVGLTAAAAAPA
jgi:hypothetical protein